VTHDDLRRPVRVIPEIPGFFTRFFGSFCLLAAEQHSTTVTNSLGWGEHLNNVKDFSQHVNVKQLYSAAGCDAIRL